MNKIYEIFQEFLVSLKFYFHSKKVFENKSKNSKKIIMIETNRIYASHISYGYLLNSLLNKHDCQIGLFKATIFKNSIIKYLHILCYKLNIFQYSSYKAFGKNKFIFYEQPKKKYKIQSIFKKIKNKNDLLLLKIDGVLIGDLIYDSYLRYQGKPTIDINSSDFKRFLKQSLYYYYFCKNLFKKYNIKSVILSHTVYLPAILGRLAIKNKASFYCTAIGHCVRVGEDYLYNENFKYYKKILNEIQFQNFNKALEKSKIDLKKKLSGKITARNENLKKSAWSGRINRNIIKKDNKIKILVATHCFFDSPHVFGNFLFNDFYEWMEYLGKVSEKTNYSWYIKPHPNKIYKSINESLIDKFVNKYKKFNLLERDISHYSFVKNVDYILTIHGNIGEEYALFDMPVINAHKSGRFSEYKFNLNPKNFSQYNKLLMNLKKNIKFKTNKKEIYKAHLANNLIFNNDIILDYKKFCQTVGYKNINSYKAINYWLKHFNQSEHQIIKKKYDDFVYKVDHKIKYEKMRNIHYNATEV